MILNTYSNFDMKCEMGILAMRERRRFNQVRRLGIEVPIEYVRIYSFIRQPKSLQMELYKYKSAIIDDSEYEDDQTIL